MHAHYGATKVLCTALLECGGVIFFFFCNDEEQARAFTLHRETPGQSCERGYSFNLYSPHSRYPKASNLVPQRYWVEPAPSGWHCCCYCLLLRKVMAGKPNHEHTILGNLNQPLSRWVFQGQTKVFFRRARYLTAPNLGHERWSRELPPTE